MIYGLKFKNYGQVYNQSLQEVILLNKCHFKLNNLLVLIRHGWNVCKNHLKLKKFYNVVNLIYLKIIYLICKKDYKNVKNYFKLICKEKENYSQDFISYLTQHYWKFFHKVHNQHQFKKISKNYLMLLLRLNLVNLIKKVVMKKQF